MLQVMVLVMHNIGSILYNLDLTVNHAHKNTMIYLGSPKLELRHIDVDLVSLCRMRVTLYIEAWLARLCHPPKVRVMIPFIEQGFLSQLTYFMG